MKIPASKNRQSGFFTTGLALLVLAVAGTSVVVIESGEGQDVAATAQPAPVEVASVEAVDANQ